MLSFARPLRAAAAAMRRSTSATRAAISRARVTAPSSPRHGPGRGRIERAVRERVGFAVLFAGDVHEAEVFDPARFPARLLEERGEVRRLHPVLAGELPEDELAVGADLDVPGARGEREVESREKTAPLRDVVRRPAEPLRIREPRGRPDPVGRRARIPSRRPVEIENEALSYPHGIQ